MVLFAGFDIGIKNLAFCVIDSKIWRDYQNNQNEKNPGILIWKNISLVESPKCCGVTKTKKVCGKNASCVDTEGCYYCQIHGRQKETKSVKQPKVKNMNIENIICKAIGMLDSYKEYFSQVSYIYLELQPKINPKMKTFSNAIQTYFLIRYQIDLEEPILKSVRYSSARNKLKVYNGPRIESTKNSKYSKTKDIGQKHTEYFLKDCPEYLEEYTKSKKKDDLADAFLHTIWGISQFKKV